ncbi:TolB amino-terminal domain-containing protein [Mesorhizobium albiziae]|uniref:TolB amino-terminal domain-containing protein n=1 Tax=Neomesorhizobium albiziae TaxID=335020 RepID=A0A1I4ESL2_9HYPH|nr:adenylate/guanylate cyclase domain-containing protein [Mesorhizobium albiziae]GLS30815.1 guanylyl cyclase [Mesorhizobium albiziae]SFL08090.1 TolB amino-terminal domain-containing protein [Mesorhizobium albiziae]
MDRKLSAILAADVVGYSALMERDEAGTFERLRAGRKELFEPEISRHHGHIFKLMGDGMLAEFASVVDAVECAVSLQRGLSERNASLPTAEQILVRIGINLGEVIVDGDDRYGDGVNIAARLQQLAEPGGICVSGKVAKEVERKLTFAFEPMGEQRVKNIAEPVQAYRVLLDPAAAGRTLHARRQLHAWRFPVAAGVLVLALGLAAAWWRPWERPAQLAAPAASEAADTRPSLVVLPFDNLSDDKEQEYLANGFTEDLTTELARVPGLFVVSRNAAFVYKNKDPKPEEVTAALGVRYLLEGSIRRVGDDMRINAQLIDSSTSGHLWAERFDGRWAEVFALQDKVVSSIAGALQLRLMSGAQADRAGGTTNPAAYEAYLKGMDIYNRVNTPEEFAQAVKHFQQAVQLDPDFGAAYAQLAWAYWNADITRAVVMGLSWDEAYGKIHETLKAAARHPSPGYYQLVAELMVREHNSDEAVTVLLKSVALDPSDTWNYLSLANALNFNGRPKEALSYLEAAARVDPISRMDYRHYQAGLAEFGQGKFEDAVRSIEKMDLDSPDPQAKFYALQVVVSAYGHLGRTDQAAAALETFRKVVARRMEYEPSQLLTQDYMVFKNTADIDRLLAGLTKAGVPDLPALARVGMNPKDRLTGGEIRSLMFGHEARGKLALHKFLPMQRATSADGTLSETVGQRTRTGASWVQGNFLCDAFPGELTSCGAIYRNVFRTPGRDDEYKAVYRWNQFEFSVVK